MTTIIVKSSVVLLMLQLLFEWAIKGKTSFRYDRVYLLSAPIIALVASLVQLPQKTSDELAGRYFIPEIQVEGIELSISQHKHFLLSDIIFAIIIIGTFIVLLRILYKFALLFMLYFRGHKEDYGNYRIVYFNRNLSPFTFFSILFFPENDKGKIDEVLLNHELAHACGRHTFDNLLMEFASLIWWFHPSFWALRKALLLNHEYLADEKVLENGYEVTDYQQMLLAYSLHTKSSLLGSSFNQSELLNRMKMMLIDKSKMKNTKRIWLTTGITIVILSMAVIYNSCETGTNSKDETNNASAKAAIIIDKEEVFDQADVMPTFQGGDLMTFRSWVMKSVIYPNDAQNAGIEGKVYISFVIHSDGTIGNVEVARGVDPLLDEEAVRVITSSPKWIAGQKDGKAVATKFTMPVTFKLN